MKVNQIEPIEEIQELKKLVRKTRDVRMKTRYDTVKLYLQGRSLSEISAILVVGYHTAYRQKLHRSIYRLWSRGSSDQKEIRTKKKVDCRTRSLVIRVHCNKTTKRGRI